MPVIVPNSKPQRPRDWAEAHLAANQVTSAPALLGVRGYYRDSMGAISVNDRGIYDDAIFLLSGNAYATFNANTDPSIRRPRIATLLPGVWSYRKGKHKINSPNGYPALIQAAPVTVARDDDDDPGSDPQIDTGLFGINIHRGSYNSTSSEGCQTIHPSQWDAFLALVYTEMDRAGVVKIPYVLVESVG
jgi:lysozyme